MIWKIALVLGILGTLLGIAVVVISAALVPLTNGRTSVEEAMIGIIPGSLLVIVSFPLFLIGLVLVLKNRKKS